MKKSNFFSDAKLIINSEIIKNCNKNSVIFRIFNNTGRLSFNLIVPFCQRANSFSSDCTSDSHLYTPHSCHTFKKISGQILFCIWFVLSLHTISMRDNYGESHYRHKKAFYRNLRMPDECGRQRGNCLCDADGWL